MRRRCKDPAKANSYLNKGVTVCDEWLDYREFYEWSINNGFDEALEIDRIDADKGYSPDNCRWITHYENVQNIIRPDPKDPSTKIQCDKCGCYVCRYSMRRHQRTTKCKDDS